MAKFIVNIFYAFICLFAFEVLLYIKDYNDLMIFVNYIIFEIKNDKIESFISDEYEVKIKEVDGGISYEVRLNRSSFIKIGDSKNIKYNGIVYLSEV